MMVCLWPSGSVLAIDACCTDCIMRSRTGQSVPLGARRIRKQRVAGAGAIGVAGPSRRSRNHFASRSTSAQRSIVDLSAHALIELGRWHLTVALAALVFFSSSSSAAPSIRRHQSPAQPNHPTLLSTHSSSAPGRVATQRGNLGRRRDADPSD